MSSFFSSLFGGRNVVYIHSNKPEYYAGDVVEGTVSFSVIDPCHVDGVYLKIKGYQEVEILTEKQVAEKDPRDPQKTVFRTVVERSYEKQVFFRRRVCIYSYKATLYQGMFVYPFSFALDKGLPGSFRLSSDFKDGVKASVLYKVKAEIAIPGMFKPNIKHSQELIINEPFRRELMASDTYKEANVTFLCCVSKGTVSLAAKIDKNAYMPGEMVNLNLIVDNSQSQVNLQHCSLKLVRTMTFRAQGVYRTFTETVCKVQSPNIPIGDRVDRIMQLGLPHHAEASTNSRLVKCEYDVVVLLSVPWSPDVTIKQPVQLVAAPRIAYQPTVIYPVNMQPTYLPTVNIQNNMYATY